MNATVSHPSLKGTLPGTLAIVDGRLQFQGGEISVEMPLAGLAIEAGGHNNEHLFLKHPNADGWLIITSDPNISRQLSAASPETAQQMQQASKAKLSNRRIYFAGAFVAAVFAGIILLLFALKSPLAAMVTSRLPASWEVKLGDQVFQTVKAQGKITEDPKWRAQLDPVVARLKTVVTNSEYNFQFHILEAKELNAFAIPGGHIVVHTGLLEAVSRPEELAGVLAHEMAHVTRRHSLKNMVEAAGLGLMVQTLFGDLSGLAAVATEGTRWLMEQKFSRDTERDADDVGWNYLVAAKIDPRGMIEFFEKLKREAAKNPTVAATDGSLNLLSTHPATPERIARLEAKWKAISDKNGFTKIEKDK